MYCRNCGSEVTTGYYCTNCGTYVGENAPTVVVAEPLSDIQRLKRAFSSKLFLAVAILLSVDIGAAFLGILVIPEFASDALVDTGELLPLSWLEGIPMELTIYFAVVTLVSIATSILPILQLVNGWRIYVDAKKHDTLNCGALKVVSIVTRIEYILSWILPVITGIIGVLIICMFIVKGEPVTSDIYDGVEYNGVMMLIISIMFLIVTAVWITILLLYIRKKVRFAKELAASAETGVINLTNPKAVYKWMLVMGIISGVSVLSGGFTAAIPAAIEICLSFWVKENFVIDE